jgi:nicotinamidase/pyrazinamidase
MKVLLLVDIQNDFCPGGTLAVPDGDQVVPVANALLRSGNYDLAIATADCHPANHVSFADNHAGRAVFEQIDLASGAQTLWPRHCVQGTTGAELHPELGVEKLAYIVEKGTDAAIDSYSGFFDNGQQKETRLRSILEHEACQRGLTLADIELTVCGLALDYCVAATVRDAVRLGIHTELVVDACRSVNLTPGDDVRALKELAGLGVVITESREVLPVLSSRPLRREVQLVP